MIRWKKGEHSLNISQFKISVNTLLARKVGNDYHARFKNKIQFSDAFPKAHVKTETFHQKCWKLKERKNIYQANTT